MSLVANLYNAFSDVPKATLLSGCNLGCCMLKRDREFILTQPLRQVDAEILWYYPSDAIWTVGSKLDFKYFVPRLLELALSEYNRDGITQGFIAFPETFGKKLALAEFEQWNFAQRKAVDNALLQVIKDETLREDFYQVSGWINAICHLGIDKTHYLDFLDSEAGNKARDYFLLSVRGEYNKEGIMGPFWDELTVDQTKDVVAWLVSREDVSDRAMKIKRRLVRRDTGVS